MKNKKIYLLVLLLLVCILSISTISATENTANKEVISANNNQETNLETGIQYDDVSNSKENVEIKEEENNNDKVSESKTDKTTADNVELTFKDLNSTINDNTNSTIYLSNNYKYNSASDSAFKDGISISRNLTIYGNGVTINGNNMARIFNVTDTNLNVNFYNINFINANTTDIGGAILGGNAYNCTFTNNTAFNGAAISYGDAYNCKFTNNYATSRRGWGSGGAIAYGNAYNCTFTKSNNTDYYISGTIYWGNAYNCTFTNNNPEYYEYAIITYGNAYNCTFTNNEQQLIDYGNAYNCTFTNNKGPLIYRGNAYNCTFTNNNHKAIVYGNAYNCTFTGNKGANGAGISNGNAYNCTFTNNTVTNDYETEFGGCGGAISNGNAYNCTFTENKAEVGGAIYRGNAYNCTFTNNIAIKDKYGDEGYGGAIYQGNATNCIFTNNTAGYGGAIFEGDTYNCNFTGNTAIIGGAIAYGNAYNGTFKNNNAIRGQAMALGSASLCRFNGDTTYDTTIIPAIINVLNYTSTYGSGEKLKFNLTVNGMLFDGFNTTIKIYKDDSLVKTVYGLTGDGWIVDLELGNYTAELSLTDYPEEQTSNATISIKENTIIVIAPIGDVKVGQEVPFNYSTNSNGTVTIKVNGQIIPDSKFTPTKAGTYNLNIEIAENDYYIAGSGQTTFTVEKTNTTILISPIIDYVVGETIPITFETNSNATATIKVNGEVIPDGNFTPTKDGTYNLTIEIIANDYYTQATKQTTFTVEKTNTTILISPIIDYVVGETIPITFITNSNATATIKVNGQPVTDAKFTPTKAGTYNLTIEIAENDYYTAATNQTTFTIGKLTSQIIASPVTTTYNVAKNLVITLKDSNGKAIKGAVLTVNLGSSKKYTTDANGQVKINVSTLTPKTYNAKITYDGSDNYKGSTALVKVTVKKATPKITAKSASYKLKVKTKIYTVNFKDNKNQPLKNTKVTLKVNGKTYSVKTNSKGQGVFKITNLKKKGTYAAVITVPANTYYNKASKNVKIAVKP